MKFVIAGNILDIELEGREQLWALKTRISIAKKDIITARYAHVFRDWRKWEVRMPGTGLPGKLIAGSFWTDEGWDFLYIKNPHGWLNPEARNVLYIETKLPKYRRIVITSPAEQAESVVAWAN